MAEFRYLRASEWGMTWKRPGVPEKLLDPEVFVHHTAGSRLGTDAVAAFQALNRYAQTGKNYSALDYDILIHRDVVTGLITIGGGREEWRSAATLDRNEEGEAVCVMGYFHPGHALSEQPHPDEIEGVACGIVWGIENGWIARDAKILGHRDNPAHPGDTGCPGDYFYPHMPTVRARVAEMLSPPPPPPPTPIVEVPDMILVRNAEPHQFTDGKTYPARNVVWELVHGELRHVSADEYAALTGIPFTGEYTNAQLEKLPRYSRALVGTITGKISGTVQVS